MTRMYINWDVIVRRILGKATEQDNERVERWLAEDEGNRTYYRKAERYFNVYYTGEKQRQVDVEEAWNEFLVSVAVKKADHDSGRNCFSCIHFSSGILVVPRGETAGGSSPKYAAFAR